MMDWMARAKAEFANVGHPPTARTDEIPLSAVLTVPPGAVPEIYEHLASVLAVPTSTAFEKHDSSSPTIIDPDRWCWPHSSALNGAEIDTFARRLSIFTDKGLPRTDGEALADKLVIRDRESDDRRSCLECSHFAGYGTGSWRCGNRQVADVAFRARDAQLPVDLVVQLQRCDGFVAQTASSPNAESEATPSI